MTKLTTTDYIKNRNPTPKMGSAVLIMGLVGTVAIALIWLVWSFRGVHWVANYWHSKLKDATPLSLADLGQAGDIFGGVSAFFSALAFLGVGLAAYYQHQAYVLQRIQFGDALEAKKKADTNLVEEKFELMLERAAAKDQRVSDLALAASRDETQRKMAQQELFHGLFFRMVGEMQRMSKELFLQHHALFRGESVSGELPRKVKFQRLNTNASVVDKAIELFGLLEGQALLDAHVLVEGYYKPIHDDNSNVLGPFFRNLFHTFSIINESSFNYSEQCRYSKIARASIDEDVLLLIALNGLTYRGYNLKPIIEKYGLLKHLDLNNERSVFIARLARRMYAPRAFQGYGHRRLCYDALSGNLLPLTEQQEKEAFEFSQRPDDDD